MKKKCTFSLSLLLINISMLCLSVTLKASIGVGDIAIIGLNCDPNASLSKTFAIVALKKLPASEVVYFSDKAYYQNAFGPLLGNGSEGRFSWTTPVGGVAKGTMIMFTLTSGASPSVTTTPSTGACAIIEGWTNTSGNVSPFGANGDSMLIYQGSEAAPTFIFGFNSGNNTTTIVNGWNTGLTTNPNAACELPSTLAAGTSAIGFGGLAHIDNLRYAGILTGTKEEILAEICNQSKWASNDNTENDLTPGTGVFNGTNPIFGVNSAPTASAVTNTGTLQVGNQLTGNYTFTDVDADTQSGSTFKWYRSDNGSGTNKAAIGSATSQTYTLVLADLNKYISFEVRPRDGTVFGTAVESALRGPVSPGVLPITLLSFTAEIEASSNSAKLQWQTTAEKDNVKFIIYRSIDGITYVQLGERVAAGNSTSVQRYSFTDSSPFNGHNYYKLVQVDKNGELTEVGFKQLNFNLNNLALTVYPNPTDNELMLYFLAGNFSHLELVDLNGKRLQNLKINAGEHSKKIYINSYPAGTYFVRLVGKQQVESRKIIKR